MKIRVTRKFAVAKPLYSKFRIASPVLVIDGMKGSLKCKLYLQGYPHSGDSFESKISLSLPQTIMQQASPLHYPIARMKTTYCRNE